MRGCNSRRPHQLCRLSVSTRPSLQNSAYFGRHEVSLPFSFYFGTVADKQCTCLASKLMWERYPPAPPAFARDVVASEGCRAEAHRVGGLVPLRMSGLRVGRPISICGKLDQSTEMRLINSFRWVRLPLPLPILLMVAKLIVDGS